MNRNTHVCNFESETTLILTRNVTWNSSAPNATPITSNPLTTTMAGGAWKKHHVDKHCHLRAEALLDWLQPHSLDAWNTKASRMSLLKFRIGSIQQVYQNMNTLTFWHSLRWPLMFLLQTEVKQVVILVAQNFVFLHKINMRKQIISYILMFPVQVILISPSIKLISLK